MANQADEKELEELRKQIFITGYKGKMAHLASCFSCLEIVYTLYMKGVLRYDLNDPEWEERDRFILSKGHAGLALYSVLLKAGLMSKENFESYLTSDSVIGGEPCMRDCTRIEATTGSLGHGLSIGMGMAMALKSDKKTSRVYVLLGDGECEEGTVWEAAMTAPAFGLDNLCVILDCNKIQKMDFVENIIGNDDWVTKWKAFGWDVIETNGHDVDNLKKVFDNLRPEKPVLIIADTVKGKGVSIMENNPNWHFKIPGKKELKVFKEELHISDSELE